jgi:hypothetical protein
MKRKLIAFVLGSLGRTLVMVAPQSFAAGWYLLEPPMVGNEVATQDLRQWQHGDSYDSAKECRKGQQDYLSGLEESVKVAKKNHWDFVADIYGQAFSQMTFSECIDDDDPRLAQ